MGPEQLGPVMVLLDIDRFKTVNQRWGHAVGDDVLCRVAHALAANLRSGDYLARLGGDEFGVLFASRDERSASARMEELRRAARVDQGQHAVTASAGCGLIGGFSLGDPEKGEPEKGEREQQNQDTSVAGAAPLGPRQIAHQLYSAAVEALREAKQRGRDRGALRRAL